MAMASSWDRVGQAASVMQVTGVDAFGLVSMIVQAAHTARRNRDLCQQLAQHVQIVDDLLRKLDIPALRQHLVTRNPLDLLDAALFRAYKLVRSCAQQQENRSQFYQMFTGAEVASKLRQAQEEIDRYIILIPMITLVADVGALQVQEDVVSNDAAPTQRNRFSLQQVTETLAFDESPPQGFSIDMETRRNGREARRKAWHQMIQNVRNGLVDQVGRYLTYGGDWKMTAFTQFNFSESDVLSNIREENVMGGGGSGKVYRIHLRNGSHDEERGGISGDGRMVAVKRLWISRKVDKEFESEVKVLGNIRHDNIVKLLCYISSQEAKLLVYEYMENGSLDRWLHFRDREGAPAPLDWPTRLAIAVDAAKGLSYMHHHCAPPIMHRDVKSSNILLDPDFQAKMSDFGLARILVKSSEPQSVSAIVGTFGYMAPEYGYRPKVTEKVDVYSFGVVLLELTTGKVANDSGADLCLAEWAWRRYQKGAPFDDIVDEATREPAYMQDILSVFTLGVICTGENPLTRPSMKEVLHQLVTAQPNADEDSPNRRDPILSIV